MAALVVGVGGEGLGKETVHAEPVWRDRADFIIGARLPERGATEQLWARQLDGLRFEICCIPFFLYGVALGDVVETSSSYDLVRVVERSGRFVLRVWFGDSYQPRDEIVQELRALGLLMECSPSNLLAVDAVDQEHAELVAGRLAEHERLGHLVFETERFLELTALTPLWSKDWAASAVSRRVHSGSSSRLRVSSVPSGVRS